MKKVIACVDGAELTSRVVDYAAWAATRLVLPLEFLHVLDRHPETAPMVDLTGAIGMDAQEALLEQLSDIDEQRSRKAQEHGQRILDDATARARAAGLELIESRQRHGSLTESLLDLQGEARLIILGQHAASERPSRSYFDQNLERVVRSLHRPILAASTEFRIPGSFLVAFDGSSTGRKMIVTIAESPLLQGLACHVVMAGEETPKLREDLGWAVAILADKGFNVSAALRRGEAEPVLCEYVVEHALDLLVMGAYGHSRIREFVLGSTTTSLLRTSPVSVLVMR